METAARIDRRGASAMAAAVKAAAEGRRKRHWYSGGGGSGGGGRRQQEEEEEGVNPDMFEPLLYAQLALTSPSVEPSDCRCDLDLCTRGWAQQCSAWDLFVFWRCVGWCLSRK